jgi:hypothetical protein
VANVYGNGSLFITMTCNPKWAEITSALLPGQTWEDRADVVNRVFRLKLQAFVEDLRSGAFFKDKHGNPWKAKYTMHVIEFQKRGKPHGHIVMRFVGPEEDMPKSAAAVDALIGAAVRAAQQRRAAARDVAPTPAPRRAPLARCRCTLHCWPPPQKGAAGATPAPRHVTRPWCAPQQYAPLSATQQHAT